MVINHPMTENHLVKKEKILDFYENLFDEKYQEVTWEELFLLRINQKFLEDFLLKEDLQVKLKPIQLLCQKCLEFMKDGLYNRKFNSTLTLCIIFKTLFIRFSSFSDVINIVCSFKNSDVFFKSLLGNLSSLLKGEKAVIQISLALIVILLSNDLPHSNVIIEYFNFIEIFQPLIDIFSNKISTFKMKNNSLICLSILLRKKNFFSDFIKLKEYKELRNFLLIRFTLFNKNHDDLIEQSYGGYLNFVKSFFVSQTNNIIPINITEMNSTLIMFYEFVKSNKKLTTPILQEYIKFSSILLKQTDCDEYTKLNFLILQILLENDIFYNPNMKLDGYSIYKDQNLTQFSEVGCLSEVVLDMILSKGKITPNHLELIHLFIEKSRTSKVKSKLIDWKMIWDLILTQMDQDNFSLVINIINLSIIYGNEFLQSKSLYFSLFAKILKHRKLFIFESSSMIIINTIFNHFSTEIGLKYGENPSEDDIFEVVKVNINNFTLKKVNLLPYEKYIENPNHMNFMNQLFKVYFNQIQIKIKESF